MDKIELAKMKSRVRTLQKQLGNLVRQRYRFFLRFAVRRRLS